MDGEKAILRDGVRRRVSFWGGGVLRANAVLAYSGDGEPKESYGEDDNGAHPPPLGIPVPLNITCGDKEGQKKTYRVDPEST